MQSADLGGQSIARGSQLGLRADPHLGGRATARDFHLDLPWGASSDLQSALGSARDAPSAHQWGDPSGLHSAIHPADGDTLVDPRLDPYLGWESAARDLRWTGKLMDCKLCNS